MANIDSLEIEITSNAAVANEALKQLTNTLGKLNIATSKYAKSSNSLNNILKSAKVKFTAYMAIAVKLGNILNSLINNSADYTENLNLFVVSMGSYAEEAYNFAMALNEAVGIDYSEFMRNQGVFMTLTKGFGVATDRAYTMSQQLTQLGYDLSSFFNIDVETAMLKLQSGIAGELEPLRRLGYDLSEAKLQATALSLGIDKSVKSMTQAEKAELRYYAILNQVTWAQGDMARTLDQPANQIRVLQQQVTQLARALGDILIPILNDVLPYLIAIVKVLREVIVNITSLLGITLNEVDWDATSVYDTVSSVSDELEDQEDTIENINKLISGFDELNIIGDSDESEDTDSFTFDLTSYDFLKDAIDSKVDDLVTQMKEFLGLTEDAQSWTELMDTNFGSIATAIGTIVALITGEKVLSTISSITTMTETLYTFFTTGAGSVLISLASFLIGLFAISDGIEEIKESSDNANDAISKILLGIAIVVAGAALVLTGVGALVAAIVAAIIGVVAVIIYKWDDIKAWWKNTVIPWVKNAISSVGNFFSGLWDGFLNLGKNAINGVLGFFERLINTVVNNLNHISFDIPSWLGGGHFGLNLSTVSLPRLADGGFVDNGQLFIAREAGAEMVGSIGSRTAVANNDQIVAGISEGVSLANADVVNAIYTLINAVNNKDMSVNINDDTIARSASRGNQAYLRRTGMALI